MRVRSHLTVAQDGIYKPNLIKPSLVLTEPNRTLTYVTSASPYNNGVQVDRNLTLPKLKITIT